MDEKLMRFHQAIQGSSSHYYNLQLGDLDQPSSSQLTSKSTKFRSVVEKFLESIDSLTLDLMKKYLSDNKDFLDKPVPPKIALYEDIKIIYEFKRGEEEIILNKGKAKEAISEKLALVLRRSKATILDRMKKKLYKLTTEEIQQAIMINTPFNFDKKNSRLKTTVPSGVKSMVDRQENKISKLKDDVIFLSEEDEITNLEVGFVKNEVKHEPKRKEQELVDLMDDLDREIASAANEETYEYGKPNIQERIFIMTDMKRNRKIIVTQSKVEELREKLAAEEKKEMEELKMKTSKKTKDTDEEWKIQEEALMPKKEEKQGAKFEEYEIVENIDVKEEETQQQEANSPKEKQKQKEGQIIFSFMRKQIHSPFSEPPKKELNYQQEQKKLLYKLNNNEQNFQRLCENPELKEELIWSEEEDRFLYQFCFNAGCDQLGITCLLRNKTLDYVIKRCNFLNLKLDSQALAQLKRLTGRLDEPMDIV